MFISSYDIADTSPVPLACIGPYLCGTSNDMVISEPFLQLPYAARTIAIMRFSPSESQE
jgi:hypothetical protein